MVINFDRLGQGGGSGSGSTVNWVQEVTGGTEIAKITIDGVEQNVYAPEGGSGEGLKVFYLNGMTDAQRDALRRELYVFKDSESGLSNYVFYIEKPNKDEYNTPIRVYVSRFEYDSSIEKVKICFSGIFASRSSRKFWSIKGLKINNNGALTSYSFEEYNIDNKQDVLTAGSGISIDNNVISCTVTGGTGENNYQIVDTVADIDNPAEGMLAYERKIQLAGITVNKGENTGGSFRITYEEGFSQEFYLNGDLGYLILQFDGHNIEPDGVWVNGNEGRIWAKWDGQVASIASTGTYDHISSWFDIEPVVTTDLTFLIELGEHSTLKQYNGEEWKERRLEYNAGDGIDITNGTIKCTMSGAGYRTLTSLSIDSDTGAYSIDEGKLYDAADNIYRQGNRFWNDDSPQNVYMVYVNMGDNHYGYSVADIYYGNRADGYGLYYNFHFGFRFYDPFENKYYYGLWLFDNNSEPKVTFVKKTEF